jgi:hypothetical protein
MLQRSSQRAALGAVFLSQSWRCEYSPHFNVYHFWLRTMLHRQCMGYGQSTSRHDKAKDLWANTRQRRVNTLSFGTNTGHSETDPLTVCHQILNTIVRTSQHTHTHTYTHTRTHTHTHIHTQTHTQTPNTHTHTHTHTHNLAYTLYSISKQETMFNCSIFVAHCIVLQMLCHAWELLYGSMVWQLKYLTWLDLTQFG